MTPHEWGEMLERAAKTFTEDARAIDGKLSDPNRDWYGEPLVRLSEQDRRDDFLSDAAALRTLAAAMEAAKPVAKSLRSKGPLLLLLTLPEAP